ncbi:MAG TPA: ABC transporter permease [Candidatus Avilachnospira avicola]|nr:ABC transporter permease [Candidatus Avilachnospira avicola]
MKFTDLLGLSINNLKRRRLRTFLTVLGVVIGTASIVVMLSLGIGQSESNKEMIESYGSLTTITVYSNAMYGPQDSSTEPLYITDDAIGDFTRIRHVTGASPILRYTAIAKQGVYEAYLSLQGVSHEYMENIPLSEGHIPPRDSKELSIIYGNQAINDFQNSKTGEGFWSTGETPDVDLMGRSVFIIFDRDKYYSQGSTDADGNIISAPKKYIVPTAGIVDGGETGYGNYSYGAYCDIELLKDKLKSIFKKDPIPGQPTNSKGKPLSYFVYDSAEVYVDDMDHVSEVQEAISSLGFQASSNMEWLEQSQDSMRMQQAVLGGIGAVSLFVAAIGIANTMMMSIYERTKEIGVMKVLGCDMDNIRDMFLMESGFIGLMGGVVGIILSLSISKIINVLYMQSNAAMYSMSAGDISRIPLWLLGLALIFAVLVGMLAGLFPALRAMRLSPLSAIRNE